MPASRRSLLIGNPAAGRGAGAAALARAASLLKARGCPVEVIPTKRTGHASELAAAADAELVIALGGDGTVRDVAEGLAGSDTALAILPLGTGNDLARTLAIPRDLGHAVEIAVSGTERRVDLWRWNDRCFINVAAVGIDAAVAAEVNRRFRRLRGALAYVAGFAVTLPRFEPFPLELKWAGGEWSGTAWLAAAANGCCYGGGMRIAPEARADDGLLDLVVVGDVPRLELVRRFPGIFAGRHLAHPGVHLLRVPGVEIQAPVLEASLDGEIIGTTPATITHAGTLRVRVPAGHSVTLPANGGLNR